jgi:hypothetical protein
LRTTSIAVPEGVGDNPAVAHIPLATIKRSGGLSVVNMGEGAGNRRQAVVRQLSTKMWLVKTCMEHEQDRIIDPFINYSKVTIL